MSRLAIAIVLIACAAAFARNDAAVTEPTSHPAHAFARGMTISCYGSGQAWASDHMVESMAELKAMGVDWIAIHPYAGIRSDGTVAFNTERGMYRDPVWITRPIREAHALGLKIMIKPHIAYWGSEFSWRGEITFEAAEQWARFFETYEKWITFVATLAKDADAFVVGTELDATAHHSDEWRAIIKRVRSITDVPLTYAANWDQFERIEFWDDLDVIGIQAYFPLVGHGREPSEAELNQAWHTLIDRLRGVSRTHGKKILLAELGYNRSANAAREPWDYKTGGENAEAIQVRCMEAALGTLAEQDVIVGAFLWKWFPGSGRAGRGFRGNFIMFTPAMRAVIERHWGRFAPADEIRDPS